DIKHLKVRIEDNTAVFFVEFESSTDSDEKYREVREKINKVSSQLPDDLHSLDAVQWSTSNTRIMQLALVSKSAPYHDLHEEARGIKRALERVRNVKQVEILGEPDEIVQVNLDLERLGHFGLSLSQVAQAIQSTNASIPGGTVSVGSRRFTVKTSGSYRDLDDLRQTVLQSRNGTVLYLSDVATVEYGYKEHLYKTRFNGSRCLFLGVKQKENSDIFLVVAAIRDRLSFLNKSLPPGMQIEIGFDQSESVASSIGTFTSNLSQGILLVGVVILLVVGARASAIVMIAIPASFLIGIACVCWLLCPLFL
ncbi:MAG: efflux RND transporter permease subunit, partial [Candidatus Latescibacteria bacterium]|nr:efflux RND transporter permease subunit [Candidatus Latescibacterota bacterium]